MLIQQLERRRLMTISYDSTTFTYTVTGTSGADTMYAAWQNLTTPWVQKMQLSDGTNPPVTYTYYRGDPQPAFKLNFVGGDGNDNIDAAKDITGFTNTYTPIFHQISIDGGLGADTLSATDRGDTLIGGNQNDLLLGGNGNDLLQGGNHNDTIYGYGGNDILYGQAGDDSLNGGAGADLMNGGTDTDVINASDGTGTDTLDLDVGELYSADPGDILQ